MTEIKNIFEAQQKNQDSLKRTSAKDRIVKLRKIEKYISDRSNIEALQNALYKDFKKPASEVLSYRAWCCTCTDQLYKK